MKVSLGLIFPMAILVPNQGVHLLVGRRYLCLEYFHENNLPQQTNVVRFSEHRVMCWKINNCCRLNVFANHSVVRHIPKQMKFANED